MALDIFDGNQIEAILGGFDDDERPKLFHKIFTTLVELDDGDTAEDDDDDAYINYGKFSEFEDEDIDVDDESDFDSL